MPFEDLLRNGPVLIDGAWGTQLQTLGLPSGACPDPWNIERPDVVEQVPRAYVEAGSQIVLTNTFRANRIALGMHRIEHPAAAINRAGAEISRRAASGQSLVFGCIGPSGRMLMAGEVTEAELRAAFEEQAGALADGGADGLVVETMSDLTEATLALEAAKQTGLPVVVTMVFDSGAECDRTMMGVTPEQAARTLTDAGADIVGANCGRGVEGYIDICRRLRGATDRPLWIKANAGVPQLVDERVVYPMTAPQFAACGPAVVAAGASFIGGCCGTNPDVIRALQQELSSLTNGFVHERALKGEP